MIDTDTFLVMITVLFLVVFGPPIVLRIIAERYKRQGNDRAKIFFIMAGVYLLIASGICGALSMN
ncbi:MAG: hypothetical protein AAFQ94_01055 [Bacteroidota bacterium]